MNDSGWNWPTFRNDVLTFLLFIAFLSPAMRLRQSYQSLDSKGRPINDANGASDDELIDGPEYREKSPPSGGRKSTLLSHFDAENDDDVGELLWIREAILREVPVQFTETNVLYLHYQIQKRFNRGFHHLFFLYLTLYQQNTTISTQLIGNETTWETVWGTASSGSAKMNRWEIFADASSTPSLLGFAFPSSESSQVFTRFMEELIHLLAVVLIWYFSQFDTDGKSPSLDWAHSAHLEGKCLSQGISSIKAVEYRTIGSLIMIRDLTQFAELIQVRLLVSSISERPGWTT